VSAPGEEVDRAFVGEKGLCCLRLIRFIYFLIALPYSFEVHGIFFFCFSIFYFMSLNGFKAGKWLPACPRAMLQLARNSFGKVV
jgi:hypothetical protein